jgi:hypothetical protein
MLRPDRARLRSAGFVALLTCVFLLVNSQVVYAAGRDSENGDLLAPLNITSSEGVPIDGYELNAEGGSVLNFKTQSLAFALSGLFMLIRLLAGLAGWAIEVAFRFPLLKILVVPAQKSADTYNDIVVDSLGLKGLLLSWSFVFTGFMIVRGRVARGLGEMVLTLLIAAFAASAFLRPDTLLSAGGPIGQAQQVAAAVAKESVNSYDWGGKLASRGPCDNLAGRQEIKCLEREGQGPVSAAQVARPLQNSVTNALIVKPYMMLQYGRILDPAKPEDRKAYAVHLKWITGGYKPDTETGEDGDGDGRCDRIKGEAKKYCERADDDGDLITEHPDDGGLPALTPGGELLNGASGAFLSEEDMQFAAFIADMKKGGPVGEACAAYASKPTWWRVGGALLLLVATLFIAGMLLSSAIVLLGTQGACAGAAAAAGVTFVAAMLPGPARQSVWKWLSLWGIACLAVVAICAFIPFFAIAVDATITDGPDLMVERMLLLTAMAVLGAALHRRLLTGITAFGQRMAMRMRYAKVGGTHLPGDTSELGAALAMNSPAAYGASGLRGLTGGGGRFGILGTRQRLMRALASMADGAGMPVDPGGLIADARADAARGLAPVTAATAVAGLGARLGAKGAHWLLIGRRPDRDQLARWRRPTAAADDPSGGSGGFAGPGGAGGPGGGSGGRGPLPARGRGASDRHRDEDGLIADRTTGEVLHNHNTHRTLLATRAHNRLVRFRGYRILNRTARTAYGTTMGLPANIRRARAGNSRYTTDARQQVRVWGNTVREDARAWGDAGRRAAEAIRTNDDSSGPAPFTGRRLPRPGTTPTGGAGRSADSSPPIPLPSRDLPARSPRRRGSNSAPSRRNLGHGGAAAPPQAHPARLPGDTTGNATGSSASRSRGDSRPPTAGTPHSSGSALSGGRTPRSETRHQAQQRFQELLRRTQADADRLRREREQPDTDGEGDG